MNPWSIFAVAVFLVSRALLFFRYSAYVTDVPLYQAAGLAVRGGLTAYCDYWFPYPPLSLPLVFLPAMYGNPNDDYRDAFRVEMFLFDVICFAGIWMFLKHRTGASERRRGIVMAAYGLLGLAVGHLLLDRLDVVMSAVFIWTLFFFTSRARLGRPSAYLLLLMGALFKLLPLFLLPTFMILEAFSGEDRWPDPRRALRPLLWVAVPFALVVLAYNQIVCEKLIPVLAEQGSRGIQVESNWALPLVALKIFRDWPLRTDYIYGAFHINGSGIPTLYLLLSKYVGFGLLVGLYGMLARKFRRSFAETERMTPYDVVCLFYLPLLLIIVSQRVLSPQYVIWLMPLACVQIAVAKRPAAALFGSAVTFGLTYVVFDVGFFPILTFHPLFCAALLVRNAGLILWTADLLRRVLRSLRRQRSATMAGL